MPLTLFNTPPCFFNANSPLLQRNQELVAARAHLVTLNHFSVMENQKRYLVKAVYIYSNGDTTERSYNQEGRKRPVSIISQVDEATIREYENHYQLFLRVDKSPTGAPSSKKELFTRCVNILTKMLLLK